MKMPKLYLRDLFWLVLVAAMAVGWWADRIRQKATFDAEIQRVKELNALVLRFFHDELSSQEYLTDWSYRDTLLLIVPKALRSRVQDKSEVALEIDEATKEMIANEMSTDNWRYKPSARPPYVPGAASKGL